MPVFTAASLDRLLEPGASTSGGKPSPNPNAATNSKSSSARRVRSSKPETVNSKAKNKLTGYGSNSSNSSTEQKFRFGRISPALYTTPKPTPLPDSPSSAFPPSPYIINHKRRGPRLLKSSSRNDVTSQSARQSSGEENDKGDGGKKKIVDLAVSVPVTVTVPSLVEKEQVNGLHDGERENGLPCRKHVNDLNDGKLGSGSVDDGTAELQDSERFVAASPEIDSQSTDYFDARESMSCRSNTDGEDNGVAESSLSFTTSTGEFFDAWEELSSDGGPRPSLCDVGAEVREMRLSLLMEIEKRKQAEEALSNMRSQWQKIVQQLSVGGFTFPADPSVGALDNQSDDSLAKELCQQVHLARFVSESVGRGTAKAQMEMEMEAQMEAKNFEITRLLDRLHYYEAMNREMSQRNQETIEMARRDRKRRKRTRRWVLGLVAAAITLGTGALVWSYLPGGKGGASYSGNQPQVPEENDIAK
ncbi:uncharacterized protein LOC131163759 [Malania oleifera]|uniref:uncharacterized protein LOC131163759 n=1 Tax=Malania oleifera TaxID=397392 RepID=UPI0025ADECA0|nr:uncharacterized protein LOC131163759 [Malania oleifera]